MDEEKRLRAEFKKLVDEAKALQDQHKGKPMPQNVGEEIEAKLAEAENMQKRLDGLRRTRELDEKGREIVDPTLPPADPPAAKNRIAGYMTLGDWFTSQKGYQAFMEAGAPVGQHFSAKLDGHFLYPRKGSRVEHILVPLTVEERKRVEALYEAKAVPTLGAGVLEPQRVGEFPKVLEREELRLRDVFRVFQTSQNSIDYLREESHTLAAAETAYGSAKPEGAIEYTEQNVPIRDIPVWMPVLNQQLADWPQLRSLIDEALRYDVALREEQQLLWGTGVSPQIAGLFTTSGIIDIASNGRYVSTDGDTLIDAIRMGITDVRTGAAKGMADVALLHPTDWESVILEKGTDAHYVWVVVTNEQGSRIWGLRVVESESMQEPSGEAVEERRLAVIDTRRCNAIYDRMQTTVTVGLVNDDFVKNKRTILAEERIAHAIFRPAACAYLITRAETT